MIEDIKLIGIDDDMLEKMISSLGYDLVLNLAVNHKLVSENIEFLKSLNIQVIDELLLNKTDIFLKETEELKNKFNKENIEYIVEIMNNDYTIIDELL